MRAEPVPPPFAATVPSVVRLSEVMSIAAPTANWLWQGFLAAGKITLLTSLWKMGKTTLLSVLLAKMRAGGELAGRRVAPARPIVITEESPDYWAERGGRLSLDPDLGLICQPYSSLPTLAEWRALMDHIEAMVDEMQTNVLVIDPLATFLPGRNENNSTVMLEALLPLQTLKRRGVAVLLLHHPRKLESELGHFARGSGALSGHADILLELRSYPNAGESDRRRRLCGRSRFIETPRQVVLQLNDEGTDYAYLGEMNDESFQSNWEVLRTVLLAASDKMTRRHILQAWPVVEIRPGEATLWRWLERAVKEGKIQRTGTGRNNSPFKYWLPEAEARWKRLPFYLPDLPDLDELPGDIANPIIPPSLQETAGTSS